MLTTYPVPEGSPMSPEEITLVEGTMTALADRMPQLAAAFYADLFGTAPETRAMFGSDLTAQGEKFTTMLAYLVRSLRQWTVVEPAARDSGRRHVSYGVATGHYQLAGTALINALAEVSGESWTPEAEHAWRSAYALLAELMMSGARAAETGPARQQQHLNPA
jgi:hemoglobin-like flavoprotein